MRKIPSKHLNIRHTYNGVMIAHKHDFELNPDLVYLIESLKVEGYWNPSQYTATICNKNLPFLKRLESIIKRIGIKPYKRILIKVKLNDGSLSKKDITFMNESKKLNFHIEISPFDGSKKIVTSQPYRKSLNLRINIKNKEKTVKIKENREEFEVVSEFKGFAYLTLVIPSVNFIRFISELVEDKKKLRIDPFLLNSNKEFIIAAFSALIDSEGSIDHYKLFRKIRIRMYSKEYLKDWQTALAKYDIKARFSQNSEKEYGLCIEGWEDFNKLKEMGLKLHQSKKKKKFNEILNSYKRNQVSRNSAEEYYLNELRKLDEPITAREFAEKIRKSKRTVNHYLERLIRNGKIKVDKSKVTYLYSL